MNIEAYFGDYTQSNIPILNKYISMLDDAVTPYYQFGKPFFKGNYELHYATYLQKCQLNEEPLTPEETFSYIAPLFQNLPNWNHPGTIINVIPPVNLVAMASKSFSELYNSNFAQDTYAGLLIVSELEVTKYIAELLKWDWKNSHGIFTFGGKGTNLYATKIALTKASPETQESGCKENGYFMITSKTAHPCHYEVCNWLGIGKDNCIEINCDTNGKMNLEEAEQVICKNIESGKQFLGYNLNGGSTNELTIDPIQEIAELNQKIIQKYKLAYAPHIHVDSVLGWVYLFFNTYDFIRNPLNIEEKSLKKIQSLNNKVQEWKYADSLGIDFHKTGFCPYVSSLFIVKDREDFYLLNSSKEKSLEELYYGNYNPFETTLELTRSSGGAIAALTTMKSLGIHGFQKIISNMFEATEKFREIMSKNEEICIINQDTEWLATLFILKPEKYKTLSLDEIVRLPKQEIETIKEYNTKYTKYVLEKGKKGEISFTYTSSRSYKIPNTNIQLGAIKAYPMSVFLNKKDIDTLIEEIQYTVEEYKKSLQSTDFEKLHYIEDTMVYRDKEKEKL